MMYRIRNWLVATLLLLCAQPGDTTARVLLAAAAETLSARTLDALRVEAQRAGPVPWF